MKILGMIAAASLIAVTPVAAQHTTTVTKTVSVHHDEHPHMGPNHKRICKMRRDHRGHMIRQCWWG